MKKQIIVLLVLFAALWLGSTAFGAIIVGRISHVEGQIYRYMESDQSWVETYTESPAGTRDALSTGNNSRAAIIFPNDTSVRLAENTEIEILNLDGAGGSFILHAGLARFYNRSTAGSLSVQTVRGTAEVMPQGTVDIRAETETVEVAPVLGKAKFQSFMNGIEQVEVISGGTSLEFRAAGMAAATAPIDRKWSRWCADREGIRSRNRQVRSKHLPETMQEYAHVLEPYGSWRRIYQRGFYYWAWKPRHVAVGWAPYATGYWNHWQGVPVWMDHNPWGWVTHHYGHWIHMHGAWMWTPYVHVSPVPGVTVIGFNISFGRKYSPHWHPGRVRWIAHSSYVGWMPLAPWETYYGYRSWGPGSIVVNGKMGLSLTLNLANHRYIDHAVIIPKHYFHQAGKPVVINNYHTVKINKINKTVIVKNYNPVPTVNEKERRKYTSTRTGGGKTEKRGRFNAAGGAIQSREPIRVAKRAGKDEQLIQNRRKEAATSSNSVRGTGRNRAANQGETALPVTLKSKQVHKKATNARLVRSERKIMKKKHVRREKIFGPQNSVARAKTIKNTVVTEKSLGKSNKQSLSTVKSGHGARVKQENKYAVITKERSVERKQIQKQTRITRRQNPTKEGGQKKADKENSGKYIGQKDFTGKQWERKASRPENYSTSHTTKRESRENRQGPGRKINAAGLHNHFIR